MGWEGPCSSATERAQGFVERHWSPHLDTAGSGGWELGSGGEHSFPPECAERRDAAGMESDGKGFGGKPCFVGTPPCKLSPEPANSIRPAAGLGDLTRLPGASASLARLCRLQEAGGLGAGADRLWAQGAGVVSKLCCSGLRRSADPDRGRETSRARGAAAPGPPGSTVFSAEETNARGWAPPGPGPSPPLPSPSPSHPVPQRGGCTRRAQARCKRPAGRRRAPFPEVTRSGEPGNWLRPAAARAASEGGECGIRSWRSETLLPRRGR